MKQYTQTLLRQATELGISQESQSILLKCVKHSYRPLRLRELAGFLMVTSTELPFLDAKSIAKTACYPFLEVLSDETVQVFHHSFTEFLLSDDGRDDLMTEISLFPAPRPKEVHRWLALTCMKTLIQAGSQYETSKEDPFVSFPILDYAQQYWVHHLTKSGNSDDEVTTTITEICQAMPLVSKLPNAHLAPGRDLTTPLRVAAYTGMMQLARDTFQTENGLASELKVRENLMLGKGEIPWGESSLAIAISRGHLEIVKLLWVDEVIAKINEFQSSFLMRACEAGSRPMVSFLLEQGCRPPAKLFGPFSYQVASYRLKPRALEHVLKFMEPDGLLFYISKAASDGRYDAVEIVVNATASRSLNDLRAPWKTERFGTPLFQACGSKRKTMGHVECARILIPHHGDINAPEDVPAMQTDDYHSYNAPLPKGSSVLHALVAKWSDENHHICAPIFRQLMDAGADINRKDDEGQTPIAMLFWLGWVRSVYKPLKVLIAAGADIDVTDSKGDGLIMRALKSTRDVGLLQRLLHADANRLDGTQARWNRGYWQSKPFLGAFWYNTNGPDGQTEVLDYLLAQGAIIEDGGEPVQVIEGIFCHGQADSLEKVLATRSDSRFLGELMGRAAIALHRREDAKPLIQTLLNVGANINARDGEGLTPLMRSAISKPLVEIFLSLGADVNARDDHGGTALHHLVKYSTWPESVSIWLKNLDSPLPVLENLPILITAGCDPLVLDNKGKSVLDFMMSLFSDSDDRSYGEPLGQIDMKKHWLIVAVQKLLEIRQHPSSLINTALHSFFDASARPLPRQLETPQFYLPHLIEILKAADPSFDINHQDVEGLVPLHIAAMTLSEQGFPCMDILRDHGAQLEARTADGRSLLHAACRARNPSMVSYLCSQVPTLVSEADHRGRTPLFEACVSGFPETVAILLKHGAMVEDVDNEGRTPFHACAEFCQEQETWESLSTKAQSPKESIISRSRPFPSRHTETEMHDLGGHPRPINIVITPPDKRGPTGIQIQRPLHAITAVLRILLDHAKRSKTPKLPQLKTLVIQYINTRGGTYAQAMIEFLEAHMEGDSDSPVPSEDLDQTTLGSLKGAPFTPENFLASCTLSDVRHLRTRSLEGFNFSVEVQEDSAMNISKDMKVWRKTFLELVAKTGLSEVLITLAENERPLLPRQHSLEKMPGQAKPMLLGEQLEMRELEWMLEKACESSSSNLTMLQTLVENFSVEVNLKVHNTTSDARLIHWLAKGEHYWHIDAICYIAANGANLEAKDIVGQTALHVACQQDKSWSGLLVTKLLQLNANVEAKDEDGKTCAQMVRSKTVLDALEKYAVPIQGSASIEELLLAIGRLDVDWVQMAMRSGLDVDQVVDDPVWTEEDYDSGYSGSPIHNGWPATPLLGALQFSQYEQEFWTKEHKDARAVVLRLLIEAGSNLLEPIQIRHLDVYAEMVSEREQPPYGYCAGMDEDEDLDNMPFLHSVFKYVRSLRRHLAVFFEYPDKMKAAVNVRGGEMDETLFLAACNSKLDCKPRNMSLDTLGTEEADNEEHSRYEEDADGESAWISATGFYLPMLDLGADISATDREGNNALVSRCLLVDRDNLNHLVS